MAESLRTDGPRALDEVSEAERAAKIEELLLAGLDHYFAAQHDQAINIWTRALFLDRTHARARAYIERARSALAERQRHSEELLHAGVAAFHQGEGDEARRLLQAAIDGGAPAEQVLPVLDRLNKLETAAGGPERFRAERSRAVAAVPEAASRRPTSRVRASLAGFLLVTAGALVYATVGSSLEAWLAVPRVGAAPPAAPVVREIVLPVPRRGEVALARARTLALGGHLYDALAVLDLVRATDPQRPDADRLRADIQRQLLASIDLSRP